MIIFVYGTLKRGFRASEMLASSKFIGSVKTKPFYKLFSRTNYPCMVYCPIDGNQVSGEIYEIDYLTLKRLNEYECTGSGLYSLEVIEIDKNTLQNHEKLIDQDHCLGYLYLGDTSGLLEISSWNKVEPNVHRENRI